VAWGDTDGFTGYTSSGWLGITGVNGANIVMTAALFLYMLMQPAFGALSDKIGRRSMMLWFGSLGVVCTVPLLHLLGSVSNPYAALPLVIAALADHQFLHLDQRPDQG